MVCGARHGAGICVAGSLGNLLKPSDAGGDYDVIAAVEGRLAYIEVKSSPPKHIELSEVRGFLDRVYHLRPDFAIFLEDTQLRMKDKLVVMFETELERRFGASALQAYPVRRLHEEIFTIKNAIFIANTKPEVIGNIGICLKHVLEKDFLLTERNPRCQEEDQNAENAEDHAKKHVIT